MKLNTEFLHMVESIEMTAKGEKILIVADEKVWNLYGHRLFNLLMEHNFKVSKFLLPQGEDAKNQKVLFSLIAFLESNGFTREDTLIGMGGGTTGDTACFAASIYMRGMGYIAIPTTLLAMVDSSIGGKCGINTENGKNMVGVFREADLVITEPKLLDSLPDEEMRSGLGEIIKYGLIGDREMFDKLAEYAEAGKTAREIYYCDGEEIIRRCIDIKKRMVAEDFRDKGLRKLLNLGHTAGHAFEKLSEFTLCHGEAVASGIVYVTDFSIKKGYCSKETGKYIKDTIRKFGYKMELPYSDLEIIEAAKTDKKRRGDNIDLVVIEDIGKCSVKTFTYDGSELFFVNAPASKSVAHRALICDFLGDTSVTRGFGTSTDINETIQVIKNLASVRYSEEKKICNMIKESGSTYRFLLPVTSACGIESTWIIGSSLSKRPIKPLLDEIAKHGVKVIVDEEYGIETGKTKLTTIGQLKSGEYVLNGSTTSQFISGLLMALPILDGDSTIRICGKIQSEPYVTLTLDVMKSFGVEAARTDNENETVFYIKGNQKYSRNANFCVEGDYSGCAFIMAAAGLSGKKVRIQGLKRDTLQGDSRIMDILQDFGIKTIRGKNFVEVENFNEDRAKKIRVYDVSDIPDLAPVIAVLGAAIKGTTVVKKAERLRYKESNRLDAIYENLKNAGANITLTEDGFILKGGSLEDGLFDGRNDHRIIMMLAVISTISKEKVTITNAFGAVSKSWPEFFAELHKIGLSENINKTL